MNKTEAISKINKIGKAGRIISLIVRIFIILGIVGCLIGTICLACLPKGAVSYKIGGVFSGYVDVRRFTNEAMDSDDIDAIKNGVTQGTGRSFKINGMEYADLTFDVSPDGVIEMKAAGKGELVDARKTLIPITLMGLVYCVFSLVSIIFLGNLFKKIETCVTPFCDDIIRGLKNFAYSLIPWAFIGSVNNAMAGSMITGDHSFSFDVNLTMVATVLLILALAYIFGYGAELQKESDETL